MIRIPSVLQEVPFLSEFDVLQSNWRSLVAASNSEVAIWHGRMSALTEHENQLRDAGDWLSGPGDTLSVLGLQRDEVRHSRVLAWLLDPTGHHGLGPRLLGSLLTKLFPVEQFKGLGRARPRCEEVCGLARIDIVVRAPGLTLVIENKVDADEGDGQCDDYFNRYCHEPGARFVFLTPTGRRPWSATGPAAVAFAPLSYRTVAESLRTLLRAGPTGTAVHVAQDYLNTLDKEFQ